MIVISTEAVELLGETYTIAEKSGIGAAPVGFMMFFR